MKKTRCTLSVLALIATMAFGPFASGAAAGETINLTIGGAHTPEGYTWVQGVEEYYIPEVERILAETGKYAVNWNRAWGGTIAKANETLEAVEIGLLDIGWVGHVFEPARLPLNGITYFTPFNSRSVAHVTATIEALSARFPEFKGEWEKYNQKHLAYCTVETYNIMANRNAASMKDLNGIKVGAAGANLAWLEGSGAVPVQAPGTEAYSGIQTGVFGATMQHTAMLYRLQLYEVAPYVIRGDFGTCCIGSLSINMDKFNSLPGEVRDALVAAGKTYTQGMIELSDFAFDEALKMLVEKKCTINELSEADRAAWAKSISNVPQSHVKTLNAKGYDGKAIMTAYFKELAAQGSSSLRDWMGE